MIEALTPFIELGSTTLIALGLIWLIRETLKAKKNTPNGLNEAILGELQKTNTNHLDHIKECVERNNVNLINCIHEDNKQIISLLSEIKGILHK